MMGSEPDEVESTSEFLRATAHEAGVSGTNSGESPLLESDVPPTDWPVVELHVCMGLNSCQAQPPTPDNPKGSRRDPKGDAPLAGMGTCATVVHVCHGDNACRGQGGCGYAGSAFEQTKPGDQACSGNGSCASPINVSRVFSAGPYKGKSVWKRARAVFEARMYEAGVVFGPSPGEGYPDDRFADGQVM
jgi:hypothetical protein